MLRSDGETAQHTGMSPAQPTPIVSRVLPDGTILETLYDAAAGTTAFAICEPDGATSIATHFDLPDGTRLAPYSPHNNLLASGCVLLPSHLRDISSKEAVLAAIRAYLSRYVELSPEFVDVAPYYALLTWVYDAFSELPYLRFRGDYGTGKTRALTILGSICYKPFFASGASTVSPIFHILDGFRGTLILDEADFKFSDATSELTKILNNGTVDGLPVLRTMTNRHRELNPQAFRVFGPKILAMRESFSDRALESRFLTEETRRRPLPPHIPIHTPLSAREEALELRNTLLAWRFAHRHSIGIDASRLLAGVDARTNQMAIALLSLVDDVEERAHIAAWLSGEDQHWRKAAREAPDRLVLVATLEAFQHATTPYVPVAAIANRYNQMISARGSAPMTNKWVGSVIRTRFGIPTAKSNGVYGIPIGERTRIEAIADRLGVNPTADDEPSSVAADLPSSREAMQIERMGRVASAAN